MVRDAQIDPLSRRLVHVDFLRVDLDKEVHVTVPLVLTGKAGRRRPTAATCTRACTSLPIAAKPAAIPTKLEVDVTALDIGDALHVSDLKLGDGRARRCSTPKEAIASVVAPKAEKVEEAAAAPVEGAVPAEGAAAGAAARRRRGRRGARRPAARRQGGGKEGRRREEGQVDARSVELAGPDVPRGRARQSRASSTRTTGTTSGSWSPTSWRAAGAAPRRARSSAPRSPRRRSRASASCCASRMEYMNVSGQAVARVAGVLEGRPRRDHRRPRRAGPALRAPEAGRGRRARRPQRRAIDHLGARRPGLRAGARRHRPPGAGPRRGRLRARRTSRAPSRPSCPTWSARAADAVEAIVSDGLTAAMNRFNGKRNSKQDSKTAAT